MSRPWRLLALLVCASACSHPVGPARTYGKYEGKAATTASGALSNVQTVRLVADAAARGSAFGPYTASVVSEAEESLDGLSGTFGSIQPPDERADQLRDELDRYLADALDHVTDVRVAARRGRLHALGDVAAALAGDAEHLEAFVEQHG